VACFHPISAWPDLKSGRWLFHQSAKHELGARMDTPCRQCMGCRLDLAQEKSLRAIHESMFHERSCFLTLTLDDEHFPSSQDEWVDTFNRGLKRIRKGLAKRGALVRTMGCLELGGQTHRPHGHLLVWGADYGRDRPVGTGESGSVCYHSDELFSQWQIGHCSVGDLTEQSAGYVARYTVTKRSKRDAWGEFVDVVHPLTGEIVSLRPSMPWAVSRGRGSKGKPGLGGIGRRWFDEYGVQALEQGAVILAGGVRRPVPSYYSKLGKRLDPLLGSEAAAAAEVLSNKSWRERTAERLAIREEVFAAKTRSLKRGVL